MVLPRIASNAPAAASPISSSATSARGGSSYDPDKQAARLVQLGALVRMLLEVCPAHSAPPAVTALPAARHASLVSLASMGEAHRVPRRCTAISAHLASFRKTKAPC